MHKSENKLQVTYSFLRVLACFAVVMHHYMGSLYPTISADMQKVSLLIDNVLMCNNGLFFMLSGKFALEHYHGKIMTYYKKKSKQIIVPFLLASIFYYIHQNNMHFSFSYCRDFFVAFMGNGIVDYLWFMYALIGFYLVAPFLARMLQKLSVHEKRVFLAILFGFLTIGNVCEIGRVSMPIGNFPFYDSIAFCLIGYLIEQIDLHKAEERLIYAASFVGLFVSSYFVVCLPGRNPSIYGLSPSRILMCVSAFVFVTRHMEGALKKADRLINFIAGYTFSIYLLHALVQEYVCRWMMNRMGMLPWGIRVLGGSVFIFLFSLLVAFLLRYGKLLLNEGRMRAKNDK